MRGVVDPYGISFVLVILGAFFFENNHEEAKQARQEQEVTQSIASVDAVPAKETTKTIIE
jgi:hypothetical protein